MSGLTEGDCDAIATLIDDAIIVLVNDVIVVLADDIMLALLDDVIAAVSDDVIATEDNDMLALVVSTDPSAARGFDEGVVTSRMTSSPGISALESI